MTHNNLFGQNEDGANAQAKAVRAYLAANSGIRESWDGDIREYKAKPAISRWENGREQGYVVWLRCAGEQINIAFYEHRNSDSIVAVLWEQWTVSAPTLNGMPEGVFKNSGDITHSVGYGKPAEMSDWIFEQLTKFWVRFTS